MSEIVQTVAILFLGTIVVINSVAHLMTRDHLRDIEDRIRHIPVNHG